MKLASVLVAAAFVGLSGYTIYTHLGLGGDAGPVAEVVTLPAKRPGVPEPVPAVRPSAAEIPTTQVVTQTTGSSRAPSEPVTQRAVVCDLCSDQSGHVPACVNACPHDAALRVDARRFDFPAR